MSKKFYPSEKTSKMTVMVFQLEGNDSTLQEGIKTISSALAGLGVSKPIVKTLPAQATAVDALPSGSGDHEEDIQQAEAEVEVQQPKGPPRKQYIKVPEVLNIDLVSPAPSLKAFFENHDPNETNKRYLMCMYWLKHHGSINEATPDHVHTCFRHMGWKTPKDAGSPLRVMKNTNQWLHKGSTPGSFIINHVGENQVLDLLK